MPITQYLWDYGGGVIGDSTDHFGNPVTDPGAEEIEESPRERIDRLAAKVYSDFPELSHANIEPVESISQLWGDPDGKYLGGNRIQVVHRDSSDEYLQETIFHELLHMDEAQTVVGGNVIGYIIHENISQLGRHDPWINQTSRAYASYILTGRNKPDISQAPWRVDQ
ncbi:hypothetical protein [Kineobactrum salinum]|uniref:Uncharacterized protein n=1 Tax=Kineobactrum salinum TaxID=2708301 RepID=A0A6C0TZ00_9GAMM|nr:hypothetical protein [Kineobactrum salinum]QIB64763.1 hypothetical protein G3T16_04545 [Kineobactrum salinum]